MGELQRPRSLRAVVFALGQVRGEDAAGRHQLRAGSAKRLPGLVVPVPCRWEEQLNSDAAAYGGGSLGNDGGRESERQPADGFGQSLVMELPPLTLVVFRPANLPL